MSTLTFEDVDSVVPGVETPSRPGAGAIPAALLHRLYALNHNRLRDLILHVVLRLEGGEMHSPTLRRIFKDYHDVDAGFYTHGCFTPGQIDRFTTIGRYCSITPTSRVMNRNHPLEFKSMHGLFFNPALGYCTRDILDFTDLSIGHDVWLGHHAIVLPPVRRIGTGAVIGAGAVLNRDAPPYAVLFGNPARIIRYRFPAEVVQELLASCWWEKSMDELRDTREEFIGSYRSSRRTS